MTQDIFKPETGSSCSSESNNFEFNPVTTAAHSLCIKIWSSTDGRGDEDDCEGRTEGRAPHWLRPTLLCYGHPLNTEAISDLTLAHIRWSVWIRLCLFYNPTHCSSVCGDRMEGLIGSLWFLLNTNRLHTWHTAADDKPTKCVWQEVWLLCKKKKKKRVPVSLGYRDVQAQLTVEGHRSHTQSPWSNNDSTTKRHTVQQLYTSRFKQMNLEAAESCITVTGAPIVIQAGKAHHWATPSMSWLISPPLFFIHANRKEVITQEGRCEREKERERREMRRMSGRRIKRRSCCDTKTATNRWVHCGQDSPAQLNHNASCWSLHACSPSPPRQSYKTETWSETWPICLPSRNTGRDKLWHRSYGSGSCSICFAPVLFSITLISLFFFFISARFGHPFFLSSSPFLLFPSPCPES